MLVNFFDLIVVIVDGLVIKCHYKNHIETDIVYCHPVKRHPRVQRVQPLQSKWGHLIGLQSLWPLWPSDQQCTSLQCSQTLTNPQLREQHPTLLSKQTRHEYKRKLFNHDCFFTRWLHCVFCSLEFLISNSLNKYSFFAYHFHLVKFYSMPKRGV